MSIDSAARKCWSFPLPQLRRLGFDFDELGVGQRTAIIELAPECVTCPHREPCSEWLERRGAKAEFRRSCPNAGIFARLVSRL